MKHLLFLLLFVSFSAFSQIKINPVSIGLPSSGKEATSLIVKIMPFETTAKICSITWQLNDATGAQLIQGDLTLTPAQFDAWGADNKYIEDLVLSKLGLTRKP